MSVDNLTVVHLLTQVLGSATGVQTKRSQTGLPGSRNKILASSRIMKVAKRIPDSRGPELGSRGPEIDFQGRPLIG